MRPSVESRTDLIQEARLDPKPDDSKPDNETASSKCYWKIGWACDSTWLRFLNVMAQESRCDLGPAPWRSTFTSPLTQTAVGD